MNTTIAEIEKRADSYAQMDVLPTAVRDKLPEHYQQDIAALLLQIQRLQSQSAHLLHQCNTQNGLIETLRIENERLTRRLQTIAEQYDWHKEVFSPPNDTIIGEMPRKPRITDNRTPQS